MTLHHSSPSAPWFLPQWRVLIFVEILFSSSHNYRQAECHFTETPFSTILGGCIFILLTVKCLVLLGVFLHYILDFFIPLQLHYSQEEHSRLLL